MITLGYITKLNNPEDNLFEVYLPVFDKAGISINNETTSSSLFLANLAYNPGNLNAYKVNDCVVVGFLNNKKANPVILGKLYTGMEQEATNFSFVNSLEVSTVANLPENTTIGELSVAKLKDLTLQANNAIDTLKQLIGEINNIKDNL